MQWDLGLGLLALGEFGGVHRITNGEVYRITMAMGPGLCIAMGESNTANNITETDVTDVTVIAS